MSQVDTRDFVGDAPQIGSLPRAYGRLSAQLKSPTINLRDVAETVESDPALTIQLMRLVNSALLGPARQVGSIEEAIVRLGHRRLHELALATHVVHMFRGLPEHLIDMESFWRHSIAVGLAARLLAERHLAMPTDDLFVAGLLHDMGRLVLCVGHADVARSLLIRAENTESPMSVVERVDIGTDHAHIGAKLLKKWKLPKTLQVATEFHHHPSQAPTERKTAAMVHLADITATALEIGSSGERVVPPMDTEAMKLLGVREPMLVAVMDELDDRVDEIAGALVN